jgi:hypothetical protein
MTLICLSGAVSEQISILTRLAFALLPQGGEKYIRMCHPVTLSRSLRMLCVLITARVVVPRELRIFFVGNNQYLSYQAKPPFIFWDLIG